MSLFANVACLLNSHQPQRREVIWDGRNYVGQCRHCGVPIARQKRRTWRRRTDVDKTEGTSG